jgi:hypothetical protein
MANTRKRRERKNRSSIIDTLEDDFKDIETNFKESNEFSRPRSVIPDEVAESRALEVKGKAPVKADEKNDVVAPPTLSDLQVMDERSRGKDKEIEVLKAQLRAKDEVIDRVSKGQAPLSKNMTKILAAIRSEIVIQETNRPVISSTRLRKHYKVHPNFFGDSVSYLINNGYISREETPYSGKVSTYKYWLLR